MLLSIEGPQIPNVRGTDRGLNTDTGKKDVDKLVDREYIVGCRMHVAYDDISRIESNDLKLVHLLL